MDVYYCICKQKTEFNVSISLFDLWYSSLWDWTYNKEPSGHSQTHINNALNILYDELIIPKEECVWNSAYRRNHLQSTKYKLF